MNLRDASIGSYGATGIGGPSFESINAGSLQRIADAAEKMACSYDTMRESRDYWKRRSESLMSSVTCRDHQIRALRGVITKLKRKAAQS